jgi:hypothetical protein
MPRRFGHLGPRQAQQHVVVHAWSRAWIALFSRASRRSARTASSCCPKCLGGSASSRHCRLGSMSRSYCQLEAQQAQRHAWELQAAQSAAGSAACPGASASSKRGRPSSMSTRFGQLEARSPCGSASSRGCSLTQEFLPAGAAGAATCLGCRPAQVLRAQPHAQQAQ